MDSKTPASEAKRIAELELENERLKQAYKYIHASRNSVDEELNEANKEITRLKAELAELYQEKNNAHEIHCSMLRSRDVEIGELKAELERERELRKELVNCIETYVDLELFANPKPIESLIEKAKN